MSRSEFFTRAAARYLDELDAQSVTIQIDQTVASIGGGDDSARDVVSASHRILTDEDSDW